MISIIINGKKEYYRDIDEMIYLLNLEYNIDLRELNFVIYTDIEKDILQCYEDLDCLTTDCTKEQLQELKDFIGKLKIAKNDMKKINELFEEISRTLHNNIENYLYSAFNSIENVIYILEAKN